LQNLWGGCRTRGKRDECRPVDRNKGGGWFIPSLIHEVRGTDVSNAYTREETSGRKGTYEVGKKTWVREIKASGARESIEGGKGRNPLGWCYLVLSCSWGR